MTVQLTLADISVFNGEPTVIDLRLAEILGYERDRNIRKLIERNIPELQEYGEVCSTVEQTSPQGGRPSTAYHLNEPQALIIAVLSKTENAVLVRKAVISVFMEWRKGTLSLRQPAPVPFEIDIQHAPLSAKTDYLRMIAKFRGREAAVAMMPHIGLPDIDMVLAGVAIAPDGRQCLDHALAFRFDHGETVREFLTKIVSRGDTIERHLRQVGIRAVPEGEPGMAIACNARVVAPLFADTKWANGVHVAALRGLAGVTNFGNPQKFDGISTRMLFIPATLLA